MSGYIAFDLDAFDAAESAARHAGASADAMMAGLLRLWRYCWRQRSDVVTADQLRGVFGIDAGAALVAFGFVAPVAGGYRVKGADRYLRIHEGRSKGGKAAAGNLKQNKKPAKGRQATGSAPADLRLASGSPPADDRLTLRLDTGLSANSEQRLANSEQREKTSPPARSRVLSDRLVATFLEKRHTAYRFASSVDGPALARLLKLEATDDEIDRRWRIGLDGKFKQEANTIAQLDSKWNDLAKAEAGPSSRDTVPAEQRPEGLVRL